MSNFLFLQPEWPEVYESALKAESLAHPDACASTRIISSSTNSA